MAATIFGLAVSIHEQIWKFFDGPNETTLSEGRATTFHKFPELPLELRRMVWKEVCLEGRVIDIWGIASEDDLATVREFRSNHSIPPMIHVSREAREIGLKHYTLSFAARIFGDVVNPEEFQPQIYVNFENDIICPILSNPVVLPSNTFAYDLLCCGLPIERIALPSKMSRLTDWNHYEMLEAMKLKEIILYHEITQTRYATLKKFFDPTSLPPFSVQLLTQEAAEDMRLIHPKWKHKLKRFLKEARKEMQREVAKAKASFLLFTTDTPSDPTIKQMYLFLEVSGSPGGEQTSPMDGAYLWYGNREAGPWGNDFTRLDRN